MMLKKGLHITLGVFIFLSSSLTNIALADVSNQNIDTAVVVNSIFEKAKQNNNWKAAFLTAKDAQVVFMNITPATNSKNEIGMEKHAFDQIIFVVEGKGKAILNGKTTPVKVGDMIFIPQGVDHNVINLNAKKPLKILSVYSSNDIPAKAVYKKQSDTPKE